MQKKIMIIDDEAPIRKILNRILVTAGYDVISATDGKDAIEKLESIEVDLIMVDMNMPNMNGIQFLRYIRNNDITHVPVLMVTGSSDTDLRAESYKLGVYDFIKKPEQNDILLKRVENGLKIGEMINFNEFIKIELMIAKKLQKYLYPETNVTTDNFVITTWSRALSDIGGDLYDYIDFRDGRFMFFVADVSGHSISASLYTAIVKMVFRNALKKSDDPAEVISIMNGELSGNIPIEMFITMFCGLINPQDSTIRYANAGHPRPFYLSNQELKILDGHDSFLGPIKDATFRSFESSIEDMDAIYIFSDGILDVTDGGESPIGKQMLIETLKMKNYTPHQLFEKVQKDLQKGSIKIIDDCTLMLIDFTK